MVSAGRSETISDDSRVSFPTRQTLVALLLPIAGGCSASDYSHRADHVARGIVDERREQVLGSREATAQQPEPGAVEPDPAPGAPPEPAPEQEIAPRVLSLRDALAIAYVDSRDMATRREDLQLDALAISSVRHAYSPQLALTLDYVLGVPAEAPNFQTGTALFSVSQILPTGGKLGLDASTSANGLEGDSAAYGSTVTLSLDQPLLRGGGHDVNYEPLVQAERTLVYRLREFELFREDFSIDVARRYYDLVRRKQSIGNQQRSLENNEFGRRQAEALFAVGRTSELDVLRARRSELTARNTLLEAEETVHLALDTFRIFLGLPADQPVDVEEASPTFEAVNYDVESAIAVAEQNRLDLRNREEQLEDVEREVRLARNALLPDLDLSVSTSLGTDESTTFGGDEFEHAGSSARVTLGLPIDRVNARNAYRSAEISLERARRSLEEFEDTLRVQIQSSFRELTRRLESLDIQRQLITDQTKNLRIAELRFERGELPNRDVVEANQSLLDAQNALIDEQVNYEIERLQLLRDLGILFVDETGMWK
jgi:outer membrane protein TolC